VKVKIAFNILPADLSREGFYSHALATHKELANPGWSKFNPATTWERTILSARHGVRDVPFSWISGVKRHPELDLHLLARSILRGAARRLVRVELAALEIKDRLRRAARRDRNVGQPPSQRWSRSNRNTLLGSTACRRAWKDPGRRRNCGRSPNSPPRGYGRD
jgi:hypothetical protein